MLNRNLMGGIFNERSEMDKSPRLDGGALSFLFRKRLVHRLLSRLTSYLGEKTIAKHRSRRKNTGARGKCGQKTNNSFMGMCGILRS